MDWRESREVCFHVVEDNPDPQHHPDVREHLEPMSTSSSMCFRLWQAYALQIKCLFCMPIPLISLTMVYKPFFDRIAKWSFFSFFFFCLPYRRSVLPRDLHKVSFYLFWNLLSADIQFST